MYIEQAYPEQQRTIDGTGKLTEAVIQYLVFEAFDEEEALNYAFSAVPKKLEDLKMLSIGIVERQSEDIFQVEVSYGINRLAGDEDDEEEEATVNFDCTTGSGHVTSAVYPVKVYRGPDIGKVIGWNGKMDNGSEISGCEIPVATLTESYSKVMKVSTVLSNSFRRKILKLTSRVNNTSFKGWEAGEVMFLGCSYAAPQKGAKKVIVNFNFAIRENQVEDIDGTSVFVRGWDHLDVISKPTFQNGQPSVEVTGIYVAQVSLDANFNTLGL